MSMDLWAIWENGEESWYTGLPDNIAMSSGRTFKLLGAKKVTITGPDGIVYYMNHENKLVKARSRMPELVSSLKTKGIRT